jgi:hypothetical protein
LTTGGTPAYTAVAQVQEIGDVSVTAEEVDVTTLDAGDYRDFIQGFKDPGECELSVIWDPNLATHDETQDGLIGLFTSGEVRDCAIRWNSSIVGGQTWGKFKAFLRDLTYGALNADDAQMLHPVFRITTAITLSDTAPIALNPTSASPTSAGGAATFTVTTTGTWAAPTTDQPAWLTISSPTGPTTGNATVNYSVAANAGVARTGHITVGSEQFTVNQAAA